MICSAALPSSTTEPNVYGLARLRSSNELILQTVHYFSKDQDYKEHTLQITAHLLLALSSFTVDLGTLFHTEHYVLGRVIATECARCLAPPMQEHLVNH